MERSKILFLCYPSLKLKGGAEKVLISLADHFISTHRIFILSEDSNNNFNYFNFHNKLKHIYVPYGSKNIFKILISMPIIFFYMIKFRPSIVHSHHRRVTLIFSILKLFPFVKFKLIHTSHNVFHSGRLFRFARADLFTGVGKRVQENLTNTFGFKKERIQLIFNGIEEYKGKTLPVQKHSAAVVGRLAIQKGHEYLLKAWEQVISRIPEAFLYIVGDGTLKKELKDLVKNLGLSQNTAFLGFYPKPREWMVKTEFTILPSLWEGLPLTPLEAYSVKRSIVATEVDGTPEVVIHNKTGLLVQPEDVTGLADAILFMFHHPEERQRMAEEGYKLYKEQYSFQQMLEGYKNVYESLLPQ